MFKDRLKELRQKEGLSQYELADKIFVSRSVIAKWEGGSGIPSTANLEALCKFFDVDEEWLLDREDLKAAVESEKFKQKHINIIFIIIATSLLLICFFIGGNYNLHRIAVIFTAIYILFKFFLKQNPFNKTIWIISLCISIIMSLLNWVVTAIAEPSSFFRFFYYQSSLTAVNLSLSQLSSVLNLLVLLVINTIFAVINKKEPKEIKNTIYISLWSVLDIICIIVPLLFIIYSFIPVLDRSLNENLLEALYNCYISTFQIYKELGDFVIIPLFIYFSTIVIAIIDSLIAANVLQTKSNLTVKIILIVLFVLSITAMCLSWYLASPMNTPLN